MGWTTVYTVTTKQGDFVANRYSEAQALLLMRTCDHTRPENAPHQMRTWHEMETQHTFNTTPKEPSHAGVTEASIQQSVARGWCTPRNAHKEMDVNLAVDIAAEVMLALAAQHAKGEG